MGQDYPKTQVEFERRFATEEPCRGYIAQLRWPDGFVCPQCQAKSARSATRQRLICRSCRHQILVTAGTIFEATRKPLRLWFRAMWYVTTQKHGASALGLQRVLGLRQYLTAWTWRHKLRRAMVRPGRERLAGTVEADEIYVGGKQAGARGRSRDKKAVVAVAVEENGADMGRIRLQRVPNSAAASLEDFLLQAVEPGSTIRTDGWSSYSRLQKLGYRHDKTVIGGDRELVEDVFPRMHRVAALLKRWLLGTHQGAVKHLHLDYYLDEFTLNSESRVIPSSST